MAMLLPTMDWRTRVLLVIVWSIICLAWLLGPEFVISFGPVAGGLSEVGKFEYRVCEVVCFIVVEAFITYALLGSGQRDTVEDHSYKALVQASLVGAAYAEPTGTIVYANAAFLRLFDLSQTVLGQIHLHEILRGWTHSPPPTGLFPAAGQVELRASLVSAQSQATELLITINPARDQMEGFLLSALDVTELTRLQRTEAMLEGVIQGLPFGLIICDASRAGLPILLANKSAQLMSGFSHSELMGISWSVLQGLDRNQPGLAQLRAGLELKQAATGQIRCTRKDGSAFESIVDLLPLIDRGGKLTHVVYVQRDVTADVESRAAVEGQLHCDEVTGLLKPAGFVRELTALLNQPTEQTVIVAMAAIEQFEAFNTLVGWDVGEALLEEAARRLAAALPHAVLGQMQTNEYGIALPATSEPDQILARVHGVLSGLYTFQGVSYDLIVSIGYVVVAAGQAARTALEQTSLALTEARRSGPGDIRLFDLAAETKIVERRRFTSELRRAVRDKNFAVHYQPTVDLSSGRITGAEALARWYHPLFGVQTPAAFIALAEETGLIREIGQLVLAEAVHFAAKLNRGRRVCIPVAVNVSWSQVLRAGFMTGMQVALDQAGALPSWIQLELVETGSVSAVAKALAVLAQLQAMGIGVAIDDFGTGCVSLADLATLPVSVLKVDRQFTRGVQHSNVKRAMIKAMLNMGHAKGARVVVKGVETIAEHECLLDLGCTAGQGFLFSAPLPASDFRDLVALGQSLPVNKLTGGPHHAASED